MRAKVDTTTIVRVRVPHWLKVELDLAARSNGRKVAHEAQYRLAISFATDAVQACVSEFQRAMTAALADYVGGLRDSLVAHSHAITTLTQETIVTRQRLDEMKGLVIAALTAGD